jgi:hypothetical protein
MKIKASVIIALAALVVGAVSSFAQTPGGFVIAKQQNLLLLNGRPRVLFWARGLQDPQELPAYKQAGFTALYVGITAADESLSQAKALLVAAQANGLPVIVGIDAPAARLDADGAVAVALSPSSPAYQAGVGNFLSRVVAELGDNPNIIAWMIENLSPDQVSYDTPDYQLWLQQQYRNLQEINDTWQTDFTDLGQITLEGAQGIDADRPGGLGRAALSPGLYYQGRFREVLNLWGGRLRQLDPSRPIILGSQRDYRSLMVTPELFAGQVTLACTPRPSALGGWRGIEAIDMARQANRFAAFGFADVSSGVSGAALSDWAGQCLVHGAAGLGLENWDSIKVRTDLLEAVARINTRFIQTEFFPRTPRAETAFLYLPMAGGPDYGFMPQPASAEPGKLFQAFARGTRFGGLDYLCEETLPRADLSRYATIFAPLAFTVYNDSQSALENYVQNGGVLVADWGFAVNDGGSLNNLPETASRIFGLSVIWPHYRSPLDIAVESPDDLFPSLPFPAMTSGEADGSAFSGLVGEAFLLGDAKQFMTRYAELAFAPSIVLNRAGEGYGIFATAALWEYWRRGDKLFEEFHRDLISRSRGISVRQEGLFPGADITRFEGGGVGCYRPAELTEAPEVQLPEAGSTVYLVPSGYQKLGDDPALVFFGGGGNIALPLALRARLSGAVYLRVKEYGAKKIVLELHGPGVLITPQVGEVSLSGGGDFSVTLAVGRGASYAFAPGSHHLLTLKSLNDNALTTGEVTATEDALVFSLTGSEMEITLTPEQ